MVLGHGADAPHLPRPALIDAYGDGGFRFAGMSHRGSLLCFPDGIWAWPVDDVAGLTADALSAAFERAQSLDFFLIGAGREPWTLPGDLRQRFRELSLSVDAMATGAAVRTL
ncbi:MAG: MTH938/NDUFAF3 family protein [Pseudolabrys sp.]